MVKNWGRYDVFGNIIWGRLRFASAPCINKLRELEKGPSLDFINNKKKTDLISPLKEKEKSTNQTYPTLGHRYKPPIRVGPASVHNDNCNWNFDRQFELQVGLSFFSLIDWPIQNWMFACTNFVVGESPGLSKKVFLTSLRIQLNLTETRGSEDSRENMVD